MDTTTGHWPHRNYLYTALAALFFFTFAALLTTCGKQSDGHNLSTEQGLELHQLDSLINTLAPSARSLAEKGMAAAKDSISYYEYFMRLGKYFATSETPDSATFYSQETILFATRQQPSPRINSLLAEAYNVQANVWHNFHQSPDSVISLYKRACELLAESDNKSSLPLVCANLGDSYIVVNDLPQGAYWYRRALFLVDSLALPEQESVTLYMGLAQIYLNLRDYDTTLSYYKKVEPFYDSMSPSMKAYFLNNYGNFFYYKKDFSAALKKFQQLAAMLRKQGMENKFDMYLCKINLADVWLNLGNTVEAHHYLNEVAPFFQRNGDPVAMYYFHTIRIGIAVKEGDSETVERLLQSDINMQNIPFNLVNIRSSYLSKYYERKGDYRKAYENLQNGILYADSLEHNITNMRSADIMARFAQDTLQLHHQILLEHKNATIERTRTTVTFAVAVIIILMLFLVLWYLYSHKQRTQIQMSLIQMKLSAARNRISPHFVFNVLNNKLLKASNQEADELQQLTRLIRTNLDMSYAASVTLAEELDFIRQYIEVERFLLDNKFSFTIDVENGIDPSEVRLPSMFLQILVENSIIHGLKGREGEKQLWITVRRNAGVTTITVDDNGRGFDIRSGALKKRTGLHIISQTIAAANQWNKRKMRFSIENKTENNTVKGCRAVLTIPDNIKFF